MNQAQPSDSGNWRWEKLATGLLASIYSLGLLITNLHLARFGVYDFSALSPRHILVGACFGLYLTLPILVVTGSLAIAHWASRAVAAERYLQRRFASIAAFLLTLLFLLYVISWRLHYILELETHSFTGIVFGFWGIYLHPSGGELLVLFLAALTLALMRIRLFPTLNKEMERVEVLVWLFFFVALLGSLVPYVVFVFPNIDSAVGGGQPAVVKLVLTEDARKSIEISPQFPGVAKAIEGPLLLWHRTDEYSLLTPISRDVGAVPKLVLQNSNLIALWRLPAHVRSEEGRPTRITEEQVPRSAPNPAPAADGARRR